MTVLTKVWPQKDPDEVLDYVVDWSARLSSEAINTSVWIISGTDSALTQSTPTIPTTTTTQVWLSGGTDGVKYSVTNRITTSGGRTMDQTVTIKVKSK